MDLNARRKRPAAATDEDRDVLCPRRRGVDLFPRSWSRRPSCAPVCPWPISIRPEARPFRALPGLGVLKRVICWNLRPDTLFARQNYGRIGVAHLAAKEACGAPSKDTCRKNVWESVMSYRLRQWHSHWATASIARPLALTGLLPADRSARAYSDQSKRRF